MIHDCGSFFAEYFYTGKPQCYLLEDETAIDREFTDFGKALHRYTYHAFSENDIIRFIEEIVLAGKDDESTERETFAREEVCTFHPHAAEHVLRQLENWIS